MRIYDSEAHPYSEVRISRHGTAYVSGVLPYNSEGVVELDKKLAPKLAVSVLTERLHAAGLTLQDVMKTTVFVTDISIREELNQIYRETFTSPMPARTVVEVRKLPQGSPIEIEAIAHRDVEPPYGGAADVR